MGQDQTSAKQETPRILIIDDNSAIHEDFRKILGNDNADAELQDLEASLFGDASPKRANVPTYRLESAFQGKEGSELLKRAYDSGDPFAVAFVDMRMPPGWDGVQTIRKLWAIDPDLQVLICTAYSDYTWPEIVEQLGHSDNLLILRKPFDSSEVCQIAAALTEKRRLTDQSREIVAGLEQTVDEKSRTVIEEMEAKHRVQEELLAKEKQLKESQKLEAVGSLAGGIAHEFNNLLQAITCYAEFSLDAVEPSHEAYDDLREIIKAVDRASSLTSQLLSFSRRRALSCQNMDANEMIRDLLRLASPLLGSTVKIKTELADIPFAIHGDSNELQQALLNLAINARDAMQGSGQLTIQTSVRKLDDAFCDRDADLKPGTFVRISVSDTGCGMTKDVAKHVFEPFFTTKGIGEGTGLGMSMVYGLVKQHQGHIELSTEVGAGTTFHLYLPAVAKRTEPTNSEPAAEKHLSTGGETILLAEDEPVIRAISKRILHRAGYDVLLAEDGEEALRLARDHAGDLSLAVLDVMMPNMSGREAYRRIIEVDADLPVLFCTGHDPDSAILDSIPDGYPVLKKPFHPPELLKAVRQSIDQQCQTTRDSVLSPALHGSAT